MAVTFLANYREIFTAPTLEMMDRLEDECDLGCMIEFIDENSEEEFQLNNNLTLVYVELLEYYSAYWNNKF